jgi:hypothetical protein
MGKKNLTVEIPKPKYEIEKIIIKPLNNLTIPNYKKEKLVIKPKKSPQVDSNFTPLKI